MLFGFCRHGVASIGIRVEGLSHSVVSTIHGMVWETLGPEP